MKKEFDYYIFVDYSEGFIGYNILEGKKVLDLIPLISKFSHYKRVKHKKNYIHSIKKIIDKNHILDFFVKYKIRIMRKNIEIYMDILEFIKMHSNCIIFISVDNHEYSNFRKFVEIVDGSKTVVKRESELIKNSPEYRVSLVLDTLLNIERLNNK